MMLLNNDKLNEIYSLLTKVNKTAYKNTYLLSNQVLNKNINNISNTNECNYKKKIIFIILIPFLIFWYYIKSAGNFILFLMELFVYKVSRQKACLNNIHNDAYYIDTFIDIQNYEIDGVFYDKYFEGIYDIFNNFDKMYYFIPKFTNKKYKLLQLYKMFIFFRENSVPVLSHYQLTTIGDIINIIYFIMIYPFYVLKTFINWETESGLSIGLKYQLLFNINKVSFESYQRYLYGKNISDKKKSKVISWFENQTTDKNFCSGLKSGRFNTFIYGCQLFIYPPELLSINIDVAEMNFNVIPDKILVNGKHYLLNNSDVTSMIGPSFRYKNIFKTNIYKKSPERKKILILLPYYEYEIIYMINLINNYSYHEDSLYVKFHPAVSIIKYKKLLIHNTVVTNDDLYELFNTTKIVIGAATGSMVEAACFSIPSIVIKNSNGVTLNYFDGYGKGVIWDYAENINDVIKLVNLYNLSLNHTIGRRKIDECASYYRDNYFSKPTKEVIANAFDLERV